MKKYTVTHTQGHVKVTTASEQVLEVACTKFFDAAQPLFLDDAGSYYYVGDEIWKFQSLNTITRYVAPEGDTRPYAVDVDGRMYLIREAAVLKAAPPADDPYDWYREACRITSEPHCGSLEYKAGMEKLASLKGLTEMESLRGVLDEAAFRAIIRRAADRIGAELINIELVHPRDKLSE